MARMRGNQWNGERVKMAVGATINLLASADFPLERLPDSVAVIPLSAWVARGEIVWQGLRPVCALVSAAEQSDFADSALAAWLAEEAIPVFGPSDAPTAEALGHKVLSLALSALAEARAAGAALRAESAVLRRDFMQLQRSFTVTEDFLTTVFAPQFMCARAWEFAGGEVAAGVVRQRLPVGSPGLVAVDIWAMGAGKAHLRFARETGADFGPEAKLESTGEGWVRAMLPVPLSGLAEDVVVEIDSEFALGLSLPTPVSYLDASGGDAPLALRVWKGLPGVRLPDMQPTGERYIIPASDMPAPEVQGGVAKRLRGRDAFSFHPGHDGKMDFAFKGVEVPTAANIAVYAQNFGPESVTLSLSGYEGDEARAVPLPPESHVQVDLVTAEGGTVDLYFKLRARSPVVSIFIRGIEIIPLPE